MDSKDDNNTTPFYAGSNSLIPSNDREDLITIIDDLLDTLIQNTSFNSLTDLFNFLQTHQDAVLKILPKYYNPTSNSSIHDLFSTILNSLNS